jgi:hypothetical protein
LLSGSEDALGKESSQNSVPSRGDATNTNKATRPSFLGPSRPSAEQIADGTPQTPPTPAKKKEKERDKKVHKKKESRGKAKSDRTTTHVKAEKENEATPLCTAAQHPAIVWLDEKETELPSIYHAWIKIGIPADSLKCVCVFITLSMC